jgi:hypothetical protein
MSIDDDQNGHPDWEGVYFPFLTLLASALWTGFWLMAARVPPPEGVFSGFDEETLIAPGVWGISLLGFMSSFILVAERWERRWLVLAGGVLNALLWLQMGGCCCLSLPTATG